MGNKKTIEVTEDFKFAHRGCDIVEYKNGDVVEADADLFEVAIKNKWAKESKAKAVAQKAPENKDAGQAPENKSE